MKHKSLIAAIAIIYTTDLIKNNNRFYGNKPIQSIDFNNKKIYSNNTQVRHNFGTDTNMFITPLGSKENFIIPTEVKETCVSCIKFNEEVTSKYRGTNPLNGLQHLH